MNQFIVKLAWPAIRLSLLALLSNAILLHGDVGDQVTKLLAPDAAMGDAFGYSVALSGSTALVGAPQDDDSGSFSGSAYLIDVNTGQQVFKFVASDGLANDKFGWSVDLSSTTAIVGVPFRSDNGTFSGAAYVYDMATGRQMHKLIPSISKAFDEFGFSVAIFGTTAVIGAPGDTDNGTVSGAVYVFDACTGVELAQLFAIDGAGGDNLGWSVAIDGTTILAGAPCDLVNTVATGSAYVFDLVSGSQVAKLTPSNGLPNDLFGWSVAVNGTVALVGVPNAEDNGTDSGSAFLFDLALGTEVRRLLPLDGGLRDNFGYSAALDGTTAIVGASRATNTNGGQAGAAYLFDLSTGAQTAILLANDGAAFEFFGGSVAISSALALVGASQDDDNGTTSGSSYVFDATDPSVPATTAIRNGSGLNASLFSKVSDPVLGAFWDTDVDAAGHSASVATVVVYEQPSSGVFVTGGELLLDLSSPFVSQLTLAHTGNLVRFSTGVPLDGSLFGFSSSAQAVVLGAPGYELSNALDITLGF